MSSGSKLRCSYSWRCDRATNAVGLAEYSFPNDEREAERLGMRVH